MRFDLPMVKFSAEEQTIWNDMKNIAEDDE